MIWRLVHILALFWMMAGVGSTVPLIWRAWSTNDLDRRSMLLNEAQNINVVALYPWLMLPVAPVILVVLAFQFLGDGLRDAADPYS